MAKPANIELLNDLDVEAENLAKKLGKKAKRLNRKLDPRDYWPRQSLITPMFIFSRKWRPKGVHRLKSWRKSAFKENLRQIWICKENMV